MPLLQLHQILSIKLDGINFQECIIQKIELDKNNSPTIVTVRLKENKTVVDWELHLTSSKVYILKSNLNHKDANHRKLLFLSIFPNGHEFHIAKCDGNKVLEVLWSKKTST